MLFGKKLKLFDSEPKDISANVNCHSRKINNIIIFGIAGGKGLSVNWGKVRQHIFCKIYPWFINRYLPVTQSVFCTYNTRVLS